MNAALVHSVLCTPHVSPHPDTGLTYIPRAAWDRVMQMALKPDQLAARGLRAHQNSTGLRQTGVSAHYITSWMFTCYILILKQSHAKYLCIWFNRSSTKRGRGTWRRHVMRSASEGNLTVAALNKRMRSSTGPTLWLHLMHPKQGPDLFWQIGQSSLDARHRMTLSDGRQIAESMTD